MTIYQEKNKEARFGKLPERPQQRTALELLEIEPHQAAQIERAKREWEITVDSLPQLVCLLDDQRRIIRTNRTVERWQLGQVTDVKGREVHKFLHAGCTDLSCYLATFLDQVWEELAQGQSVECEARDEIMMRHFHLQIHPLSTQTSSDNGAIASFVVLILDDITERKQTEATLRQYALELAARNQDLDAFAHTVAHNLKGSLAPIMGYAEWLANFHHATPVEKVQNDLETIVKGAYKMNSIIDELLLLASVHNTIVEREPLDMAAIVAEVQMRLVYVIEQFQAELILPAASTWPVALGYGPWVEEVWVNYLSNSIKYGGRPPRLELGATVLAGAEGLVRFWVRDNGPGLTPQEQAKLFAPFTRLNQGRARGHGLGLSIVRRIVEKLGGQVGVESEGVPGQGCVFSFTLPGITT